MNFINLPDLVIIGILRNAMIELDLIDGIKNALPFLAIDHRWRALALPIMYRYVFIEENGFSNQRLESNIGLVMNGRYTNKLSISVHTGNTKLIDILESLLIQMNPSKLVISQSAIKLFGYKNKISAQDNPESLNIEVIDAISECLQNFTPAFPNITGLHISLSFSSKVNGIFASQLINIYKDQLTELSCDANAPLDITHFPKGLIKLDYTYPNWGTPSIPAINPYPLKELSLSYSPDTWSWQQYCESSVFANLELLSISTSPNNQLKPIDKITELRVDLPCLKRLCVNNRTMYKSHPLKFGDISEHLDGVSIDGNVDMLNEIGKLTIKSIGWLCVCLRGNGDQNMEFYRATNQLFSNHTNILLTLNGKLGIDYKQTRWENVKELMVDANCANGIIDVLTHLTGLKAFTVNCLYYEDMDESLLKGLVNSNVEKLEFPAIVTQHGDKVVELEIQLGKIRKYLPNISRI